MSSQAKSPSDHQLKPSQPAGNPCFFEPYTYCTNFRRGILFLASRGASLSILASEKVSDITTWCPEILAQRGDISIMYSSLAEATDKPAYARSWKQDLEEEWDLDTWHQCFQCSFKGVINVSLIEANIKILLRWCLHVYPDSSPLYFRGCDHIGTFFHTWWSKVSLTHFSICYAWSQAVLFFRLLELLY